MTQDDNKENTDLRCTKFEFWQNLYVSLFHLMGFAGDIWKVLSSRIKAGSADWVRRESSGLEPYFLRVCVDVA